MSELPRLARRDSEAVACWAAHEVWRRGRFGSRKETMNLFEKARALITGEGRSGEPVPRGPVRGNR